MGWIKAEDGKRLLNVENARNISIEYIPASDEEGDEDYRLFVEISDNQAYWLTEKKTKEEAEDILDRIEIWLEHGAQGVFQV